MKRKGPARLSGKEGLSESCAAAGLYLASLGVWLGPALFNIGWLTALLGVLASAQARRSLVKSPLVWLCVVTAGYFFLRAWLAADTYPVTAEHQYEAAGDWSKLLVFAPLAWPLMRRPGRARWVLLLALLSFAVGTLIALVRQSPESWSAGTRFGGYEGKAIVFAFYCAVNLLGLLTVPWPLAGWGWDRGRRITVVAAALLMASLLVLGLMASASRGPVVALAATYPLVLAWFWYPTLRERPRAVAAAAVAVGLTLVVLMPLADPLLARFKTTGRTLADVWEQGLDQAPPNNITWRLHMWRFGLDEWQQAPLLGRGPGSIEFLEREAADPFLIQPGQDRPWDHLHSLYVQLLFSYGLVGALLGCAVVGMLYGGLLGAWRRGSISRGLFAFLLGNGALIAVYSFTDLRHLNSDWRAYWLLSSALVWGMGQRRDCAGPVAQPQVPAQVARRQGDDRNPSYRGCRGAKRS